MVNKVKNEALFFLAIIVLAIYLRLQGLGRGLPYVLNPEETDFLSSSLYLVGNFISSPYLHLTDSFVVLSSFLTMLFAKSFNINALVTVVEVDPAIILFPFRVLALISSVISVVCVYFIARGFGGFAAIGAATMFAISLLSITYSTIVAPIVFAQLFILFSLLFLLNAYRKADPKLVYIGLVLGIASAYIHPIGLLSIFPIAITGLALKKNIPTLNNFQNILTFLFFFVVLNPVFLFRSPHHFHYLLNDLWSQQSPISYIFSLLKTYAMSFGLIALIFFFFLPWALKDNRREEAGLIFTFPVIYFVILNMFHLSKLSHQVLMMPYIAIAVGIVSGSIYSKFSALDHKWQKLVVSLILFMLFWTPFKGALTYSKLIRLPDTRIVATQWIKKKTNQHYTVAWDRNSIQLNHLDALDKGILGKAKKLTAKKRKLIRRRFVANSKLLKQKNWFKILKKKTDYVVINSMDVEKALRPKGNTLKKKYYKKLLKEKPVAVFNPYYQGLEGKIRQMQPEDLHLPYNTLTKRERFGPLIKIYEL